MTRKDYRAFAEMLHNMRVDIQDDIDFRRNTEDMDGHRLTSYMLIMLDSISNRICQIFARDNPRFDSERFIKAVREGLK